MLLKCCSFNLLLLLSVVVAPTVATPNYRHFYPYCEEEIWEEVPCDEIATTTSTRTTTTTPPTTSVATTRRPYTTVRPPAKKTTTTKPSSVYSSTATPLVITTTPSSAYNSCYCECKVGCKEFCRKVTVNGASQKEITQITKTSNRVSNGQLNSEHVHQQRFVPDPHVRHEPPVLPPVKPSAPQVAHPIKPANEQFNRYAQPNLAYKVQPAIPHVPILHMPAPQPPTVSYSQQLPNLYEEVKDTNIYPDALLESSYSVDELTRLLQMESLNRDVTESYSQPSIYSSHGSLTPTPFAPTPIYHSPSPSYGVYSSPAPPPAASKSLGNSSTPEYKSPNAYTKTDNYATSLVGSAESQYGDYINKIGVGSQQLCSSAPSSPASSETTNDQQSSSSLNYHSANSNPTREYMNSEPYLTHYTPPVTGYNALPQPYAMSY